MANLKFSTTTRNAWLDRITSDAGTSAKLRIFAGTQPGGGGAETTLLVELTCDATAFAPAAAGGVLTLNSVTGNTAVATGTASWFRIQTSGDVYVFDGDVTSIAVGTGDLLLDDTAIVLNGNVSLSGPNTLTAPNAP